jgi:two-component system cell cycle sensor histidine kinase/response regulator CckA
MNSFRTLHHDDHEGISAPEEGGLFAFPDRNPNPVLTLDGEGGVLYTNPAAQAALEGMGAKDPSLLLPEDIEALVARSLAEGRSFTGLEVEAGDRCFNLGLHPDPAEQRVNVYAVDITDRVRIQQQLELSEERFRAVFEGSAIGVALMDPDGVLLEVNPALLGLLELEGDRPRGASLMDHIHPEDAQEVRQLFAQVLARERVHAHLEHQLITASGQSTWGRTTLSTTRVPGREHPFLVAMIEDLNEYRQLQQQVQQSQKVEAVGMLASGVAHDFNNILAAILGHAEMTLLASDEEDARTEALRQIVANADRGRNLTRQLLAFSRRQVLAPRQVDLGEIVENLKKMLERLLGSSITMESASAEDLWPVKADPGQMEQVVMNLVVNARDAMPEGGRLSVTCSNTSLEEERAVASGTLEAGDYVRIRVADTGTGMSEEVRARIFDPFFTTKPSGKGTGLGLSTVRGIIEQSRGAIDVESRPGEGTTFLVYLPRSTGPGSPTQRDAADPDSLAGEETVLLLEENDEVRDLLAEVMRRFGYHVEATGGERDAVEVCRLLEQPVDMVISDVTVPGIRGPACIHRIREMSPRVRFLLLTGFRDARLDEIEELYEEAEFLPKPFHVTELLGKVRSMLDDTKRGKSK